MEKWRGKNAVVIGANSGIGASTTYTFLENGINVYAWDKETSYLDELKGDGHENLTVLQTDITVDDEIQNSISYLEENTTSIDIVVFSAGIMENNSLIDGEFSEWEEVLNTNFIGLCLSMKTILNLMMKQNVKYGQVIVMNSKEGVLPLSIHRGHYYSAVDRGILAVVESIKYELKEKRRSIKVTVISAGLVKTNLFKSEISKAVLNVCIPLVPDDVVQAVNYVLSTPRNILINKIEVAGRGFMRQHIFQSPGDKVVEKFSKILRQRGILI